MGDRVKKVTPGRPSAARSGSATDRSLERQRISAPALPDVAVARPRLVERLDAAASKRLVIVVAPPGYGKSVLLAAWAASPARHAIAWLTIEPTDDATALAAHLCATLAQVDGRPRDRILDRVEFGGREMGDSFIAALLADAVSLPPTVLVLDDFHALSSARLLEELGSIIELAPPQLHFVVSARMDPALPYRRLRLIDEVAELRAEDLKFDATDAAELIQRITEREITDAQLAVLLARTEGWGAGLQLAALSLRTLADVQCFIDAFAGDDRHVSEYLTEHVLRHLDPPVRDFLLQTSVLHRLSASLCDAVTGRTDGQQMLERLSRGSLFVTKLDSRGEWFRSHQLFRDLLRSHLRESDLESEHELLQRAADWYLERDDIETAGDYVTDGGDDLEILDFARAHGRSLYRAGHIATVVRWLDAVSTKAKERPDVALLAAAGHMLAGNTAIAKSILERSGAPQPLPPAEQLLVDLIRTWAVHDEPVPNHVLLAADRALAALGVVPAADIPDLLGLSAPDAIRKACLLNAAAAAAFAGSQDRARSCLAEAALVELTSTSLDIDQLGLGALLDAWVGSLRSAEQQGSRAVAVADQAGMLSHPGTAVALLALGRVARQRGQHGEAGSFLEAAGSALQRTKPSVLLGVYATEMALLALAEDDLERGLSIISGHRGAMLPDGPALVAEQLDVAEARLLVALGDLDRAERVLARSPQGRTEVLDVAIRIAVEREDVAHARRLIAAWPQDEAPGQQVQLLLWHCVLDDLDGADPRLLIERIEHLVAVASEEGDVQIILAAGHHARRLLRSRYHVDPTPYLRQLVDAPPPRARPSATLVPQLVEQLSDRERVVLRYLPTRLDNAEIAGELGVSVNTLKTHLKHIYRKLDVTNRRAAIAAAEELRML